MTKFLTATSAATLMIAASLGVVHAQSSSTSGTTNQATSGSNSQTTTGAMNSGSGQREAGDITCSEVTAMDTATVPGVLYFISGYSAGQQRAMDGSSTSSTNMGTSGTTSGTSGTASTDTTSGGSSGTTASGSGSTGTTASGSGSTATDNTASTSGSMNSDTTASTSGSTTTDSAASTSGSTASGASGSAPQVQISSMRGYFEIPVEQALIACRDAPESRASDVLNQQMNGSNQQSAQ